MVNKLRGHLAGQVVRKQQDTKKRQVSGIGGLRARAPPEGTVRLSGVGTGASSSASK